MVSITATVKSTIQTKKMDSIPSHISPLPDQSMNIHHSNHDQSQSYNGPSPIMGQVVRVRPNIYNFICNFCQSEHRTIDNFLRHSESHFQCNSAAVQRTITQIHSNQNPSQSIQSSTIINAAEPYPVRLSQLASPMSIADTTSSSSCSEDFVEEIYEITDLGYDFDGKYPDAQNVIALSVNEQNPSKKHRTIKNVTEVCWFCKRHFNQLSSLRRHESKAHAELRKKIITQKKSYKCRICNTKFPKSAYKLRQALEHLKVHLKC